MEKCGMIRILLFQAFFGSFELNLQTLTWAHGKNQDKNYILHESLSLYIYIVYARLIHEMAIYIFNVCGESLERCWKDNFYFPSDQPTLTLTFGIGCVHLFLQFLAAIDLQDLKRAARAVVAHFQLEYLQMPWWAVVAHFQLEQYFQMAPHFQLEQHFQLDQYFRGALWNHQ